MTKIDKVEDEKRARMFHTVRTQLTMQAICCERDGCPYEHTVCDHDRMQRYGAAWVRCLDCGQGGSAYI